MIRPPMPDELFFPSSGMLHVHTLSPDTIIMLAETTIDLVATFLPDAKSMASFARASRHLKCTIYANIPAAIKSAEPKMTKYQRETLDYLNENAGIGHLKASVEHKCIVCKRGYRGGLRPPWGIPAHEGCAKGLEANVRYVKGGVPRELMPLLRSVIPVKVGQGYSSYHGLYTYETVILRAVPGVIPRQMTIEYFYQVHADKVREWLERVRAEEHAKQVSRKRIADEHRIKRQKKQKTRNEERRASIEAMCDMDIIAHRGHSKQHGDNTLHSYKQACLLGVDAIEMDVCITRDNVLVMAHNAVDKSTGVAVHCRDFATTDLRLADVFEQFSCDTFSYLLDIKDPRASSDICTHIYQLCLKYSCLERCVFGSFNEFHLSDLCGIEKANNCTLKKAYITSNLHRDMFASAIEAFGLTHIVVYKYQVNRELVDCCRSNAVEVYVYTCNTYGLESYVRSLGCQGIITDTPDQFFRVSV